MSAPIRPVVVLFHPAESDIASLVRLAGRGWQPVAVINDGARRHADRLRAAGVELIENAANVGLARALNQGIERVFGAGSDFVKTSSVFFKLRVAVCRHINAVVKYSFFKITAVLFSKSYPLQSSADSLEIRRSAGICSLPYLLCTIRRFRFRCVPRRLF